MNTGNDCMTYLVGNQVDNEDNREVTIDKAAAYAEEADISHTCETSAKTGERVEEIFITAAKMLYSQNKNELEEKVSELKRTYCQKCHFLQLFHFNRKSLIIPISFLVFLTFRFCRPRIH